MSGHQKRLSAPTSWPVERKTHTFTVKAGAGPHGEAGVPLLILLRDVLGYVDSRKEANYALSHDSVLVNGEPVSDARRPIGMFDIVAFTERGEFYRVFPDEGGRLALTPIDEADADSKLGRIVGKRQVPGGETQLTLHDGETLLVEEDYAPTDSLVVDNEDGSIVAHFPFEEGALVTAVDGQHAGEIGEIDEIVVTPSGGPNVVRVETDEDGFETIEEYVVVIDENFTGGDAGDGSAADDVDVEDDASEAADERETEDENEAADDDEEEAGDEPENDDEDEANDDEREEDEAADGDDEPDDEEVTEE